MTPDPQLVDFHRWQKYLGVICDADGKLRVGLPIVLSAKSEVRRRAQVAIDFYSGRGVPLPANLGSDFLLEIAAGRDPAKLSHTPGRIAEPRTLLMGADYFIRSLLLSTSASDATVCSLTAKVWQREPRTVKKAYEHHMKDVHSLVFTWLAAAAREYGIARSRQLETLEAYLAALAEIAPEAGK